MQINNISMLKKSLVFTYEELTDSTEQVVRRIIEFLPELGSLSPDSEFTAHNVTGDSIVGLKNLNEQKIDALSETEIDEINAVLSKHKEVLSYFGYGLI